MSTSPIYCLDANVLIQGWSKYYSPRICPDYWTRLTELGKAGRIFLPDEVAKEIHRTADDLSAWLKTSQIPVHPITGLVTQCLKSIYAANPLHINLVDNTRQRSMADPWVIAHAMHQNACIVTKEEKVTASSARIKIPNVCENVGVRCINDFQFIEEVGMQFSCSLP